MKWDQRFVELAQHVSQWSKDPSTQTGAVIVRPDKTIVSLGYNGFARGMSDREELYLDRESKYSRVIHAEMNAILNARGNPLLDCVLYMFPGASCARCAVHVIQSGIGRVVYPRGFVHRAIHKTDEADSYYAEAGVEVAQV